MDRAALGHHAVPSRGTGPRKPTPPTEVLFTPAGLPGRPLKGLSLVLIDVLRFSTTACYALHHGAGCIVPAASIEAATRLASSLDRNTTLLCGEREGDRIDGFHLGNSPGEYVPEAVEKKTLVFSTSNGTRLAEACESSREAVLAGIVNVTAAARWLVRQRGPVLIVCAGDAGRFSMEDALCAGLLLERARELQPALDIAGDAAQASLALAATYGGDLHATLERSEHGRYLSSRGYVEDLAVAANVDALRTVPVLREGRITAREITAREGTREAKGTAGVVR